MWLKWGILQSVGFEKTQKKVSIHFSTHGGAVDLKIVVIIKRKIIHGENNDETSSVTSKGLAGKLPMVRSLLRNMSITSVPEPLSAGFIIIYCRCFSWPMACRSVAVSLS